MTLPNHIQQNYPAYTRPWPVLNFFHALVHDPQLAKEFERADSPGKDEILRHFGLVPAQHIALFTPSGGVNVPLTDEDIRNVFDKARQEIVARMPSGFW